MSRVTVACERPGCGRDFEAIEAAGARFCSAYCARVVTKGPVEAELWRIEESRRPPEIRQWCEVHWAPLRDDPEKDGVAAAILLLTRFMADEGVARRAGWDPETGEKADVERINAIVTDVSPLCCYLGDDAMVELYRETVGAS